MGNGSILRGLWGRLTGSGGDSPVAPTSGEWRSRGNRALAQGNLQEAQRCYDEAVRADPTDPLAHLNVGFALLSAGEAAKAAKSLGDAIALHRPADAFLHEAHFLLGQAHAQKGDTARALASFESAVRLRPDFAEPLAEGARLLHAAERDEDALAWAQQLAALRPTSQTRVLVAQLLSRCGRFTGALAIADEVLCVEPDNVDALRVRGHALNKTGNASDALGICERIEALAGPDPEDLMLAAAALQDLGRLPEATQAYERALQLRPEHRAALCNRAVILVKQLRLREAIDAARSGLQILPHDPDLHWNMGIAHLLLGEFEKGLEESEWRWKIGTAARPKPLGATDAPLWTGHDLRGRSILLSAEQGLGDSIQFVRYVPRVAQEAQTVYLLVQPALGSLVDGFAPNCVRVSPGQPLPQVDYQCPLLSLPRAFETTLQNIPAVAPYLRAPADRAAVWKERLHAFGTALKVGLAWSGNASHANDRNRSIALAAIRELAVPGCLFAGLQPDVRESDREAMQQWPGLLQAGPGLRDFADTAALMEALDLVITVDTSVAHLAGAVGRPVWILLPYCPDWRWMVEREDSPWYPTARLYRQLAPGEWKPVLERVRRDLLALTARASA